MQTFLQSEVSAGTVKSADADALSSAIDDIGNALKASQSTSAQAGGTTSIKNKVDDTINQEVQDGKLTQDQATELKKVFADATEKMGKAHGHHHHAAASTGSDTGADANATATASATGTASASASDPLSLLANFLKTLETAASSNAVYDASGGQSSGLQSVLLNAQA